MNVQLLYFDGCPNWLETKQVLEETLAEQRLTVPVELVNIESNQRAQDLHFVGSPTVRVNGQDVDPDTPTEGFNLECRIYWVDGRPRGTPPSELITRAVAEAAARS